MICGFGLNFGWLWCEFGILLFGFECVFFSGLDAELGVVVVGVSQNLVEIGISGGILFVWVLG